MMTRWAAPGILQQYLQKEGRTVGLGWWRQCPQLQSGKKQIELARLEGPSRIEDQ